MQEPLISIIIATYNSDPFILQTLESIRNQSWKKIELIITDDCSTDDTVEVCRKWIHENKFRFYNSEIITSEKNQGVAANANRGLSRANGEWIKFLGADDTLKPECLEDNIAHINSNTEIKVLFSRVDIYKNIFEPGNYIRTVPEVPYAAHGLLSENRTADSQYRMLLVSDRIHFTPSVFMNREAMIALGGFDERFPMLEDYPLWLKCTKNGLKLYFMNKITVNYRQHSKAINNTGARRIVNHNFFRQEHFRKLCTYPYLPLDKRLEQRFTFLASQVFRLNFFNRDSKFFRFLHSLLTTYINPFSHFIRFRRIINKKLLENEFYM